MSSQVDLDPQSFAAGVAAALAKSHGGEQEIVFNLLHVLYDDSLDCGDATDETIGDCVIAVQHVCFDGAEGAFCMARHVKAFHGEFGTGMRAQRANVIKEVLATLIVEELTSAQPRSKEVKEDLEIGIWLAQELERREPVLVESLLWHCGWKLVGPEVDRVFSDLAIYVGSKAIANALANGMDARENPAARMAEYLKNQGRFDQPLPAKPAPGK